MFIGLLLASLHVFGGDGMIVLRLIGATDFD